MTNKQKAFIAEKVKDPTASNTELAKRAGYSPKSAHVSAHKLMRDEEIAKKIDRLVDIGLDTLEDVAVNGSVEIARATAAKTLVETGLGKPKDNKQSNFGDVTINIAKIDPAALAKLTLQS
jgi:phage terminase small subunit